MSSIAAEGAVIGRRRLLRGAAGPAFGALWEQMARTSWKTYRDYLGLPGDPVVFTDRYGLRGSGRTVPAPPGGALDFAEYQDSYAPEIRTRGESLPPGSTPFDWPSVYRSSELMFDLRSYGHLLMSDFLAAGGQFVRTEFHEPGELARLPQKVVVNCPGYAAREWWKDQSVTPVRGQIGWLIPQPEVTYGLQYASVSVLSRTDGIVIQDLAGGDMKGYGDATETPDTAESLDAVARIEQLFATRFRPPRAWRG